MQLVGVCLPFLSACRSPAHARARKPLPAPSASDSDAVLRSPCHDEYSRHGRTIFLPGMHDAIEFNFIHEGTLIRKNRVNRMVIRLFSERFLRLRSSGASSCSRLRRHRRGAWPAEAQAGGSRLWHQAPPEAPHTRPTWSGRGPGATAGAIGCSAGTSAS